MDVDSTNQRDVWLVKVPKYLANTWKDATPSTQLGKLQLSKDGSVAKFIPDPKYPEGQEHSLMLQALIHQKMVILAKNNEKISVEGDVKHRGELRPKGDMSYMNLKASSIKQAAKPTRVSRIVDKAFSSYKPRGASQLAHEADLRKKKEESKKLIREDKDIVQGRLFASFEKQQYYNIKDLVRITNQPAPYLKDILKEICIHCSRGANKGMYELKPEYRHYKSASGSQSTSGGKL